MIMDRLAHILSGKHSVLLDSIADAATKRRAAQHKASRLARVAKGLPPQQRIRAILRCRVAAAMRATGARKTKTGLLGCTAAELRTYLEGLWLPGMSWDNYGFRGWHIDHIKPCAAFDLLDPVEQAKCFHYTNLQPLWAVDNWNKNSKWTEPS